MDGQHFRDLFYGLQKGNTVEQQDVLRRAAEDILKIDTPPHPWTEIDKTARENLLLNLELDGYVFRHGRLLRSESELSEVVEEQHELATLYSDLGLASNELVRKHLKDSHARYLDGHWGDAIGNARHFMEEVLEQIAIAISQLPSKPTLPPKDAERAAKVREYLRDHGLVTAKECDWIDHTYKVLSDSGGHANMSERDHARIFRRLALLVAQFALLRYQTKYPNPAVSKKP